MSNIRLLHCLGLVSLLCVTGTGSALTIGRQQGQAVLGRPLEVLVPVALDPGMDPADLCPEVEVNYGESRVSPRLINLQVSGSGDNVLVRVRASAPLDEPFVSLQLRVGCAQKLTRRFVLLADEPAGDRTPVLAAAPLLVDGARAFGADPEAGGPTGLAGGASTSGTGGTASVPPGGASVTSEGPAASTAAPAAAIASRPTRPRTTPPTAAPAPAAPVTERPRLRLDPLDIRLQGAGSPASQGVAAAVPGGAAAGTGPASAARSTTAAGAPLAPASADASSPADAARTQALEAEIRKLQEALQNSRVVTAELRARAVEAERERYANPLVLGLGAVSALSLLLAALTWRRSRGGEPAPGRFSSLADRSAAVIRTPQRPAMPGEATRPEGIEPRGDALIESPGPTPPASEPEPATPEGMPGSTPLGTGQADGMTRNLASMNARLPEPLHLSTHELNDIQQEADFFVSLGDYDRAIEVLQNHIQIHPQSSALAWLDLMEIQHKLGRKEAYDQLRRDFEWLFNAQVPAFEAFDADHDDLEAHPELLARIQATWPEPEVQKVIDAAIFRRPTDEKGKPLGLQAYRDLLFLHQVLHAAKTPEPVGLAGNVGGAGVVPVGNVAPVSAAARALGSLPVSSQRLARDLDFDLEEVLAQPAAAPDPTREKGPRDPESQARFAQGLDTLLNFELEPLELKAQESTDPKADPSPRQRTG